jgi:6-pyruvoyltetrahydropterin/6-carboxytetrahydropterin synthase
LKTFTVTKSVEFDYGHRVPNHTSKCRNAHGHRGKVEVTVEGPLVLEGDGKEDEGMVMDFGEIKRVLQEQVEKRLDHTFIISDHDWEFKAVLFSHSKVTEHVAGMGDRWYVEGFGWVQEMTGVPTAENLAYLCFCIMQKALNRGGIWVQSVRFWETPTSVAEYSQRAPTDYDVTSR